MDQDIEIFDEARRCPKCDVVTYCDTCPICGKRLARSSHVTKRLFKGLHVAGEDETILQPANYEIHQGHIQERELSSKHDTKSRSKFSTIYKENKQTEDNMSDREEQSFNNEFKNTMRNTKSKLSIITAVIVVILVGGSLLYDMMSEEFSSGNSGSSSYGLIEYTSILDNKGEIEVNGYTYHSSSEEHIISMTNRGDRSFEGDFILLDEDGNEISTYGYLFVYPYEEFDLTVYGDEEATAYEFKNTEFYENNSTKPDFPFTVFDDYGNMDIEVEKKINVSELEILVNYMYEASTNYKEGALYGCDVYMPDHTSYEVFINENEAYGYLINEENEIEDSFDLKLKGN